jgi:hypothetical protein
MKRLVLIAVAAWAGCTGGQKLYVLNCLEGEPIKFCIDSSFCTPVAQSIVQQKLI